MLHFTAPDRLLAQALSISNHMWNRLYAEFVSLEWLLTEIVGKYAGMSGALDSLDKPQS
jgi:hypothetical protein